MEEKKVKENKTEEKSYVLGGCWFYCHSYNICNSHWFYYIFIFK